MLEENFEDFSFKTPAEADAFCKWYLRTTVTDIEDFFEDDNKRKEFHQQRERRLKVQLDDLGHLNFNSPMTCSIQNKTYFKIAKKIHKPLSSEGAAKASSRFNYKNIELMRNRAIYFGQDSSCCYAELFHLDIQKHNYAEIIGRSEDEKRSEFSFPDYVVYEFEIDIDRILVLTTDSSYKALGIADRAVKNEWFSLNNEYAIPTTSQILGTIVRKKGYKGILYTSIRSQVKNNLVLFEENAGLLELKQVKSWPFDPTTIE
jgi:RES domain-containing protein